MKKEKKIFSFSYSIQLKQNFFLLDKREEFKQISILTKGYIEKKLNIFLYAWLIHMYFLIIIKMTKRDLYDKERLHESKFF
jgi:hypothetical protein